MQCLSPRRTELIFAMLFLMIAPLARAGSISDDAIAVIEDGTKTWRELAKYQEEDIAKGKETMLDGKRYLTIIRRVPGILQTRTLLIDPTTHLVRRFIDEMDQPNNKIIRTYDFAITKTDTPISEEKFKWSPPAGWKKQP